MCMCVSSCAGAHLFPSGILSAIRQLLDVRAGLNLLLDVPVLGLVDDGLALLGGIILILRLSIILLGAVDGSPGLLLDGIKLSLGGSLGLWCSLSLWGSLGLGRSLLLLDSLLLGLVGESGAGLLGGWWVGLYIGVVLIFVLVVVFVFVSWGRSLWGV